MVPSVEVSLLSIKQLHTFNKVVLVTSFCYPNVLMFLCGRLHCAMRFGTRPQVLGLCGIKCLCFGALLVAT